MSINYAEQYASALANAYPYVLNFGALWSTENSSKYKVVDAKTIKIPNLSTGGRTDGSRESIADFTRNFDNDWETKTLSHHRMWQTLAHPKDIDETNQVASIQNLTKTMNETQKFPEMDAYLVSQLYTLRNTQEAFAPIAKDSLTKDNVLAKFDEMMTEMDEALVPLQGRKLYVDTYTKKLINNATELALRRTTGTKNIDRTVSRIDEVEIISVPTKLMKTKYSFTKGWTVAEDALQIKMFLVHPSCVLPIVSYEFAELQPPSAMSQGKYVYYEESFEDVFILNKKYKGIQMLIESASSGGTSSGGEMS